LHMKKDHMLQILTSNQKRLLKNQNLNFIKHLFTVNAKTYEI
jgi:hypothetical protein